MTNASNSFTRSQNKHKISNKSISKSTLQIGHYSSGSGNSNQGNSNQLSNTNQPITTDESDDDDTSCKEVKINNEIICISDSEESFDHDESKFLNGELYYCSICRMHNKYNHNCYKFNKEISTCLVPNCNIVCRSIEDFMPHYRQHIGITNGADLCNFCYQECTVYNCDSSGNHACLASAFKCYSCNAIFHNMPKFAIHKLKSHYGRLINSSGNFLCLYCEKSSSELNDIKEHIEYCRKNQTESEVQSPIKQKKPKINKKKVFKNKNKPKKLRTSQHKLFTCLKQSCNLIFQSFPVFKFHHREHFGIGNKLLMCWQCCSPFKNVNSLRIHQVQGNCRTPGMFKCYECNTNYDDIQNLSIHKYTKHYGDLICKNKKTMNCIYCSFVTDINNFKSHLVQCQYQSQTNKSISNSTLIKSSKCGFKCTSCNKICLTLAALSSHKKVHDRQKNSMKTKQHELININNYKETNEQMDLTLPSTSRSNKTIETSDFDKTSPSNNKNICDEINATSNTLEIIEKEKSINKIQYVDGFYFCSKCPKKFRSRQGLSRHRLYCSNIRLNPKTDLPCNYYCTKCKEYYTRSSFSDHWKKNHGKRLPYNKNKRYQCNKCPHKFVYKIAMTMHREHVHGELNNSAIKENSPDNCFPILPIISETKSLAEESMENIENKQIKEEFINTLLDNSIIKCEESANSDFEYISECNLNEFNDSGKSEEYNKSNNDADNNKNDIDVHNAQYDNIINNESDNIEMLSKVQFHDEDTLLVVHNVNEIEKNIEDVGCIDNVTSLKKDDHNVEISSTQNIK